MRFTELWPNFPDRETAFLLPFSDFKDHSGNKVSLFFFFFCPSEIPKVLHTYEGRVCLEAASHEANASPCSGCARRPLAWRSSAPLANFRVLIFIQLGINAARGPFFLFFPGRNRSCLGTVHSYSAIPVNLSKEWVPQWPREQKGF